MNVEFRYNSKIFQCLFADADFHLERAAMFAGELEKSESSNPQNPDQAILRKERTHSRAAIITTIAGVESLCRCIYDEFKTIEPRELSEDLFPKGLQGKDFREFPLTEKFRFIPVLCGNEFRSPDQFFKDLESELNILQELSHIRNAIVHGHIVEVRVSVKLGPNNTLEGSDDYPENFWPKTKLPKDVRILRNSDAQYVYKHVIRLLKVMIEYVGERVTRDFLLMNKVNKRDLQIERESTEGFTPQWYLRMIADEKEKGI